MFVELEGNGNDEARTRRESRDLLLEKIESVLIRLFLSVDRDELMSAGVLGSLRRNSREN